MKTERNILIAFILNLSFSIFEFFGGLACGSVAILSDAVHDMGDAASIGIAYFLERKSREKADEIYTYGYARYSVLGGLITSLVLAFSSLFVIFNAVIRMLFPTTINYNGMLVFAVIGFVVNLAAAMLTHKGHSINERAIGLHMLEDVLGWVVVLVGAVIMRFTDIAIIDPLMSVAVAVFILINAAKNLKEAVVLFLEKIPDGIELETVKKAVLAIEGVADVHHIHIWSLDGSKVCATMHIVTNSETGVLKERVREKLRHMDISHITLETESDGERCAEEHCRVEAKPDARCNHHHH